MLLFIFINTNHPKINENFLMDKNPLPLVPHLYKKGCDKLNIPYRIINKEDGQLIIGNKNKQTRPLLALVLRRNHVMTAAS